MLTVREARDHERAWANATYDSIHFARTAASDLQLVAERGRDGEHERVGLGRLVDLGAHNGQGAVELGGIWTHESARGRGVARCVVDELIRRAAARGVAVWCVPFEHLVAFYEQVGFARVDAPWHPQVHAKVRACVESALPPVAVLLRR